MCAARASRRVRSLAILAGLVSVTHLAACGGGGGSGVTVIQPFSTFGGVIVADLDGDGLDDVAVATTYIDTSPPHPGYVDVYLRSGPATFGAASRYPVGPDPWGLSAGDFDGDGRPDLVATSPATVPPEFNQVSDSGVVAVLINDPAQAGRFRPARTIATGGAPGEAKVADVSADGRADLVVADGILAYGRTLVLLQQAAPTGSLAGPQRLLAGSGAGGKDVATGDLNGDGLADIAVAATSVVAIFHQLPAGGYAPASIIASGTSIGGIGIADLDGDGRNDVVAVDAGNAPGGSLGGSNVIILLQRVPDGFDTTRIPLADGGRRVAIGDLNGDGIPDLAVTSIVMQSQRIVPSVTVLLQSPDARGTFAPAGNYAGPFNTFFLAIGEVTGDGRNDIIVGDGPVVFAQRAAAPGTFEAARALR